MKTDLTFVRDILNNQIAEYEKRLDARNSSERISDLDFTYEEVLAEKIAALQEFKTSLINFIAEANKLVEKK